MTLTPATGPDLEWCREMVARHHYLHKAPDPRSRPFAYLVRVSGERAGCLFFGRTEATKRYRGRLTYGSAADVMRGRAVWDRWEVLDLSRVWLSPDVQAGGRLCHQTRVPGFFDRSGAWRPAVASAAIREALTRVGFDYLAAHPPVFVEMPFEIRVVLSYCDPAHHRGTIYRAAGMTPEEPLDEGGKWTWWTSAVAGLTPDQDAAVRDLAARSPRSRRIREACRSLFPEGVS